MKDTYEQVNDEYQLIEDKLNKIDQDQTLIESNLDILEKELSSIPGLKIIDNTNKQDILSKCIDINSKVSAAETQLSRMVDQINEDDSGKGEIKPEDIYVNTNTILNNYYENLAKLEIMTLDIRRQLNTFSNNSYIN